jgi:GNAT superfamily N-acetyltransferase
VGLADVPAIAQVNSDTLRECGLAPPDIYDLERLKGRWDGYLRGLQNPQHALEERIAYAGFDGRRMVGYIAGHFSTRFGTEAELQSLYVLKSYHRKGIGTALWKLLEGWFEANGRRKVCVGIEPDNPYRRFYEKHGARYRNRHWMEWDGFSEE